MRPVATAGRTVAWEGDDAWRRRGAWSRSSKGRPAAAGGRDLAEAPARMPNVAIATVPGDPDIGVTDDEVVLTEGADVGGDPSLALRLAAVAAERNLPIARDALNLLGRKAPSPPVPWSDELRATLVRVLATGPAGHRRPRGARPAAAARAVHPRVGGGAEQAAAQPLPPLHRGPAPPGGDRQRRHAGPPGRAGWTSC